ncbi:MAG TPA: kelch repeat-containing protein, partial [Kofleriaceae bacterium]|nr:kelch repeat-containing protein [Kofleriaceae bacterium]
MRIAVALVLPLLACTSSSSTVATGELGEWHVAAAMPTPRANHCSAAIGDWVLVIGGNYMASDGFVKTDEIHAAKLSPDGTLGNWQLAGRTPSPVTECNATSDADSLFIVDGIYDREEDSRKVWTATLDDSGMLGALSPMGTLPDIAISTEAAVRNGELIVMKTKVPANDSGQTVALTSPVASLTWSTHDLQIGFRAQAEYAFSDHFIYTVGGYHDTTVGVLPDVSLSPLAGGAAIATTSLPQPVGFGEATVVDEWLFVVGGRAQVFGAPGTTQVYAAPLAADGTVGAWTSTLALPMARTNHDLVLAGD